jgi:AcrR family transcriptional regulator
MVDHEARRRELAAAVWRIAARDGLAAVTVRAVAAESGWSSGALRHYFPGASGMLLFAVDHAIDQARRRAADLADSDRADSDRADGDRTGDPDRALDTVRTFLEQLLPLDDQRRVESEVWLELAVRAQTDPELRNRRRQVDGLVRDAVASAVEWLDRHGHIGAGRDRPLEVRRLHALLDGMVVQAIGQPPALSAKQLPALLDSHLADLAAPVPDKR